MIFGIIRISYQGVKAECIDKGYKLLTSSTQWFEMMKDRVPYQRIYVEVECVEEGHKSSVRIDTIQGCYVCMVDMFKTEALDYQDVLELAKKRGLQAVSFKDDSRSLTEAEFNDLIKIYKTQYQDSDSYKSKTRIYINLKWKHLECGLIFHQSYANVINTQVDQYCPKCYSSIDQRQTYAVYQEMFQKYATSSLRYDAKLSGILPNPTILLRNEYESLRHPNVHVDMFGVFNIKGQEIKIAIEHQGEQHYSFEAYLALNKPRDQRAGIYKTDAQYRERYDHLQETDRAKVELFKELNKDGYYLIVVKYNLRTSQRADYILQELIRQTSLRLDQTDILDWV